MLGRDVVFSGDSDLQWVDSRPFQGCVMEAKLVEVPEDAVARMSKISAPNQYAIAFYIGDALPEAERMRIAEFIWAEFEGVDGRENIRKKFRRSLLTMRNMTLQGVCDVVDKIGKTFHASDRADELLHTYGPCISMHAIMGERCWRVRYSARAGLLGERPAVDSPS